jgi:hypothetical protein
VNYSMSFAIRSASDLTSSKKSVCESEELLLLRLSLSGPAWVISDSALNKAFLAWGFEGLDILSGCTSEALEKMPASSCSASERLSTFGSSTQDRITLIAG